MVKIQLIKKELPIVLEVLKAINDYENQVIVNDEHFLSEPVVRIFKEMLKVKSRFEEKALELDGTEPPKPTQPAAFVEIYPTLPLHSEEEKHFADRYKDPEQDKAPCNKDYPEDSGITGFCHISCKHGIMKGATALVVFWSEY